MKWQRQSCRLDRLKAAESCSRSRLVLPFLPRIHSFPATRYDRASHLPLYTLARSPEPTPTRMSFGGNPPRSFQPRSELSRINTNLHSTSEVGTPEHDIDSATESARDSRRDVYGRRGSGATSPGSRFAPLTATTSGSGGGGLENAGDGYGGSSSATNAADYPYPSNPKRASPSSLSRNRSSPFGTRSSRSLSLSNPIKRAWPRLALWRSRNQFTRILISVGASVLLLWLLFGRGQKVAPKERLTTRWWESGAGTSHLKLSLCSTAS